VDDDALSRDILELLATSAGFDVHAFDSGDAVVAHLEQMTGPLPHVVLADMQMPGLCGDDLALRLHASCATETRLIAMSATPVPEARRQHFDGFLLKPFTMDDLHVAVSSSAPERLTANPDLAGVLNETIFNGLAECIPPAQLRQLYDMCLQDAEHRIGLLREASEQRDAQAYSRSAHALKGGCGLVGAVELARLAAVMEQAGPPPVHSKEPFEEFMKALSQLRRILELQLK
jgi:CheY-like chemotaxis protein